MYSYTSCACAFICAKNKLLISVNKFGGITKFSYLCNVKLKNSNGYGDK